jgi:sRNA-binding protein
VFDAEHPLPLAIGVNKPLAEALGKLRAKRLLEWWTRHPAYKAAVAAGGKRYHLDGAEAGEVSEEHRAVASLGRAAPAPS